MPTYDNSSLAMPVSDVERERAERLLKEAYVDGRIDMAELDRRVGLAMIARNRGELNSCVSGLPRPPRPLAPFAPALLATQQQATGAATVAHFLPFVSWIFGPLAVWAVSAPRSYARREAAKAFNWQLTATVVLAVIGIVAAVLDLTILNQLGGLAWVGWLVLTVVGGVKAAQGANWTNPVMRVTRWNVLDPSGR